MFTNAKVGDKVWDMKYEWGNIISTNHTKETPLYVKFLNGCDKHYTYNGVCLGNIWERNNIQTLFWQEFKIPEEAYIKPLPTLEVDTKVLVWKKGDTEKHKRYFSHFDRDMIYCFGSGSSSWSSNGLTTPWSNWEPYEENKQ